MTCSPMNKWLNRCIDFRLSPSQQELLKWLALLFMTLDHANKILFGNQTLLYLLGRLAFPLLVVLICYNTTVRRVGISLYLPRLFIMALISQPVFMIVFNSSWSLFNTFATLTLGITFQPLKRWLDLKTKWSLLIFPLWFALSCFVDYGPVGVFLIPVMQWFLGNPRCVSGFSLIVFLLAINRFTPESFVVLLLPLILLLVLRFKLTLPRVPYLGYVFYPLHLVLIGSVETLWRFYGKY